MTKEEILKITDDLRFDIAHESDANMAQAMVQKYNELREHYNEFFWREKEEIPPLDI